MSRTSVLAGPAFWLKAQKHSLRHKFLLTLGRMHAAVLDGRHLLDATRGFEARKQSGPLSQEQIQSMIDQEKAKVGKTWKNRSSLAITDQTLKKSANDLRYMQHKCARLLADVLNDDHVCRVVANIGARVDVVSAYFAAKYSGMKFVSIDFQPDLKAHNSNLPQSPNWTFMTGYALDLIKSRQVIPDVVVMTSTATLMNNKELDAYFSAFAEAGVSTIVLNEPWWPKTKTLFPSLPRPEDVPLDDPYCAGKHGCYHHNYLGKLNRHGYSATVSQMVKGPDPESYCVQIVANLNRYSS